MTANTDVHTCSYYCERPGCVRRQRDELRDRMESALAAPPSALGVTKRELFTIAAMHTLHAGDYAKWEHLAQDAVSLADATIAALAAQQPAAVDEARSVSSIMDGAVSFVEALAAQQQGGRADG